MLLNKEYTPDLLSLCSLIKFALSFFKLLYIFKGLLSYIVLIYNFKLFKAKIEFKLNICSFIFIKLFANSKFHLK